MMPEGYKAPETAPVNVIRCVRCNAKLRTSTWQTLKMNVLDQGHALIYTCKDTRACLCRMKRRRSKFENSMPSKIESDIIVHYLKHGQTPCLMPTPPSDWPERHKWTGDPSEVTCKDCRRGLATFAPTYTISADGKSITCLRCKQTSHEQKDVDTRHCARCRAYHDDIWPPARKWWVEHNDTTVSYASASSAFAKALDHLVKVERARKVNAVAARARVIGLYSDLLTQLMRADIEPIWRESDEL